MKKTVYGIIFFAIVGIIGLLVYYRISNITTVEELPNAQTIIPTTSPVHNNTIANTTDFVIAPEKKAVTLSSDEILIDEFSGDLDNNGKNDYLAAVKKISDPNIYFMVFLQNEEQLFIRAGEIKTDITQTAGLTFYLLPMPENKDSALVYTGMNSENIQLFTVNTIKITENNTLATNIIVHIKADGQIILKKNNTNKNALDGYTIYAYQSDPIAPNTLNQIEQKYTWNKRKHTFEKNHERSISGKKIESNMLKQLKRSSTDSFKSFLKGLWYQPSSKETHMQSIFFNTEENEIIFALDNIQEIFTINSAAHRRYGMSFSTNNISISSIRRRVNIELVGVDEISVRVIENVERLKIGTASTWDGVYRKVDSTIQRDNNHAEKKAEMQQLLQQKKWKSIDGYTLSFSNTSYNLQHKNNSTQTGRYTILQINNSMILEWENNTQKNTIFFLITVDYSKGKPKKLILTKTHIDIDQTITTGNDQMIFE